jgi:hypothetical protein
MATGRPYNIEVKPPITRAVVAEDHIEVKLDIPPVLPPKETGEVLAGELRQRKFEDADGGTLVRERGGVRVEVDPAGGTLRVSAEAETELPPEDPSPCSCRAREAARAAERAHNDLQREVTRRLEGALGRLGCEMEGVVHRVVKEAIRRKARTLGRVTQVVEDPRTGGMTVVVEV